MNNDRKIIYTIYKNKVWKELVYKDITMNLKVIYIGKDRKDCERWIKDNG